MTTEPSTTPPTSAEQPSGLPESPTPIYALIAVLLAGLGVAIYMVQHKLLLETGLLAQSACNINTTINCDAVNTSQWSALFGLPIALYAIPTYGVLLYLAIKALGGIGAGKSDEARTVAANALTTIGGIGILTIAHAMYLAYISSIKLETYCLYCMSLYAVNITSTLLAIGSGPKTLGATISGGVELLTGFKPPVPHALGVVAIVFGVAWLGYDYTKTDYDALAICKTELSMADGETWPIADGKCTLAKADVQARVAALQDKEGDAPAAPAQVAANAPAANAAAPGANTAPKAPAAPRKDVAGSGNVPTVIPFAELETRGKKTEDGWTEIGWPLAENEFWFGNPKAKVTVVKVADFQCPYCRYLALTMHPIMEQYKDKVRFVMKNFPMNGKCNPRMSGYDKHPNACEAAYAGYCAGLQGKFWEMHDKMYANQQQLDEASLRTYAQEFGFDLGQWDACMKDPATAAYIRNDYNMCYRAGIYGTPKTYVNGRLITGSATKAILTYHIDRALKEVADGAATADGGGSKKVAPKPDGTQMIAAKTADKTFYIDPYEAAIDKSGKAVSFPGLPPALASWHDAKAACEKAGKRLCSEEEWVSACTETPAVDNNKNGLFADDDVEGDMYPYGGFYEAGNCHDQGDQYNGKPVATGSKDKCRSASGLFDMAGNVGEWVNDDKDKATLMGGYLNSGERAACNQRSFGVRPGSRNQTTGFRCCADSNIKTPRKVSAADLKEIDTDVQGDPVPAFKAKASNGQTIDSAKFKGKVTLINFFASWCGPCKKEMPYLAKYLEEFKGKGFQIVGIGVDAEADKSLGFAKEYNATWPIVTDEESELMGLFGVYSMPATYIVDRQGVVRYKDTGFKPEEQANKLRSAIQRLL